MRARRTSKLPPGCRLTLLFAAGLSAGCKDEPSELSPYLKQVLENISEITIGELTRPGHIEHAHAVTDKGLAIDPKHGPTLVRG